VNRQDEREKKLLLDLIAREVLGFFCAGVNSHPASLQGHVRVMLCVEDFEIVTSNGNDPDEWTSVLSIFEKPASN
jgi:hypothetical protein